MSGDLSQGPLSQIGFIFHVGLYSFFGYDDINSARRRKPGTQNGSEWYLERLQDRSYRPVSGSDSTQKYHTKYGNNYDYFSAPFLVTREHVSNWMDVCKKCRASYVLITARHHDGFCLWDTKTTNKKLNYDLVQIFKEEAERKGLIFGIYYSWFEFLQPMTIPYFESVCIPQLEELVKYNPRMIWFDGDWKIQQITISTYIRNFVLYLRSNGVVVNDRITNSNKDIASFYVGSDRFIPIQQISNWQHINTIGISWGYNREQKDSDYKSGYQLYSLYNEVISKCGNLLLNIGPKHDGSLDENEVKSLNELSVYLAQLK